MRGAVLCVWLVGLLNVALCAYILYRGDGLLKLLPKQPSALRLIVLTVDRPRSLSRLLESLRQADFVGDRVDLDIIVDRPKGGPSSPWLATVDVAHSAEWAHGRKAIRVREQFAGLRRQWFEAWVPQSDSERALILEDDVQVSPHFWRWLKAAHERFATDDSVAGFTLQRAWLCVQNEECQGRGLDGGPVGDGESFAMPLVGSWGFSPKARHWNMFVSWASRYHGRPMLPGTVIADWYTSAEWMGRCPGPNCMWTILHQVYTSRNEDRMTIYFKGPLGTALAINNQEKGVHYGTAKGPDAKLLRVWNESFVDGLDSMGEVTLGGAFVDRDADAVDAARRIWKRFGGNAGDDALPGVPLVLVNAAMRPMFNNWVCHIRNLGLLPEVAAQTLFLACDAAAVHVIRYLIPGSANVVVWRACGSTENLWQSKAYVSLMAARARLLLKMVSAGLPVWIHEIDQVWFKNVRMELARFMHNVPAARGAAIVALDDGDHRAMTTSGPPMICMGFVVLNRSPWTAQILAAVVERIRGSKDFDGDDQRVITQVTGDFSSQAGVENLVTYLPRGVFLSGLFLKTPARMFSIDLSVPDQAAVLHANWMVGVQSKLAALQRNDLLCSIE